ncbi:YegP family protein [Pantoea ananatis]|uniref:YegP family protein n=1 Tax=Pantoea ananas TaxID=553 RepID=UPI000232316B|nr:hypothetical protein PAGR_g1829 [Pantoea ananatis PA13]
MGYYVIQKSNAELGEALLGEVLMGDGPQYYFVLKSDDHDVIATSKMYSSKQDCQTGIASVQRNGPTTDIRDETV